MQSTTQKGAIHDTKGCNPLHGQNHHEPSKNHQGAAARVHVDKSIEEAGGIRPDTLQEFRQLCKEKGKPLTPSAIKRMKAEADKAGMTLQQVAQVCNEKRWADFRAAWLTSKGVAETSSTADPDSRASVEAEGLANGVGKWDEREHWAKYKARVRGKHAELA